jgi:polyketide synthase 12
MREPIAIVGMACKFPGDVDSPADLLELLLAKRSAIRDIPSDRWNANAFFHPDFRKVGSIHVRKLGWLSNVDRFDAGFFGISPNEAKRMDPQQRHVLETAYGAIENAGVQLEQLAGKNVAVVIGAGASDYGGIMRLASERSNIAGPSNPGAALSIVSNRVSYLFDLRGPSFTVDTACSSALTALHYACESIWSGVSVAAIAGGANSILSPELTMGFSKGGYLSPDAECRAFSDHANGYVRSEGAAAVFLKPLSTALADGDRIHALIRGTWINQDGRTQGMTVPSVAAQEDLLRQALRVAGVEPREVAYVEAHGTGTPAGDPIEATAIGNVVGRASGRSDACPIGSVKTNLGHMECAAGMGGLFKLVLVLGQRKILPNINFRNANPNIDLHALGITIATETRELPADGPLIGCVNSFGFGGANGHAVLETPPPRPVPSRVQPQADAYVVSARSASALKASAAALARTVRDDRTKLELLAPALSSRRSRFELKLAVVANDREELASALDEFAKSGEASANAVTGRSPEQRDEPVVFVYTGQGAQWFAMGRKLTATSKTFGAVVDRVGARLGSLGWLGGSPSALRTELLREQADSRMSETRIAQPCIFALQVALTEMLAERGIVPAAAVGHSIGELAAAVAAGVLELEEATRIVYWRSECQAQAEGAGAMLAIGLSERQARELLVGRVGVDIAALNGPAAITLAGTHDAIAAVQAAVVASGAFARKLDVSVPFHSHLMDPIEAEFRRRLGAVQSKPARLPFYSTVHGGITDQPLDTDYWYANIRQPVRYHQALRALLANRFACFLEVGPHPALMHGSVDTIREAGARATWIPTLRRDADDATSLALALGRLLVTGVRELRGGVVPHVELPTYPFGKERYWLETEAGRRARTEPATIVHPHVARIERSIHSPDIFTAELALDPRLEPYVGDHRAQDHIVFPAAGQLELVIAAARHVYASDAFVVEELEFRRPIVLVHDETCAATYRLEVYTDDGDFLIVSNAGTPDAPWIEHTKGRIRRSTHPAPGQVDLAALQARLRDEVPQAEFYRACETVGLTLGPAFKNLVTFRHGEDRREFLCCVDALGVDAVDAERFILHPAMLDATIHSMLPVDPSRSSQRLFLPFRVERVRFFGAPPRGRFWSTARVKWSDPNEFSTDLDLFDASGRIFASLEGLVARHVRGSQSGQATAQLLYAQPWQLAEATAQPSRPRAGQTWLLCASRSAPHALRAVERKLAVAGARTIRVVAGAKLEQLEPHIFSIRPSSRSDAAAVIHSFGAIAGVVHAWSLDLPESATPSDAIGLGANAVGNLVSAIKAKGAWAADPEVWLVTAAATTPDGAERDVRLTAAGLWGFGRVLMSEQPRVAVTLVDLGGVPTELELDALATEIAQGSAEAELALRERAGRVVRWQRTLARQVRVATERSFDLATAAIRAVVRSPGVLDSVALEEYRLPELEPGIVEVAVHAVGLNFRDVVAGMNLLDEDAWEGGLIGGHQLGLDAAGVVVRVGPGVTRVAAGDRVVGFFPHSLATRATTHERQLAKLLPGITMTEAAALPTPFSTAEIALHELARVRAGETVLIHAAAGGVGTVAVQLALAAGARVIATTSSDDKRAFLTGLGVEHIFNSRTAEFGDDIMRLTNGEGVDVVLNSLSGRAMSESLRVLRPFGRFVEIGKTDLYRNRQLGLRQFAKNKSYFVLDVNRMYSQPTTDVTARLVRAMTAWNSDVIAELPVRTFTLADAKSALRVLAQGKQIGRVVVEVPRAGELVATPTNDVRFDPAGVHLVTGGCTGFGLALAEWLADKGARKLVLAGRRGLPSPLERRIVDALIARGVDVEIRRADVTRRAEVDELVRACGKRGRLAAVFHAAMVLDDGAIDALDDDRYQRVVAPKADGALHLHHATLGLTLDHFVMFSSISSVLGTPGQASYAAANAVLDELASRRATLGLAATSINWGVIDDVGVVARASAPQRAKILNQGIRAMPARRALELLEQVLVGGQPQAIVVDLDTRALGRLGGSARRFDPALVAAGESRTHASGGLLRETLLGLPESERCGALVEALSRIVSSVAGLAAAAFDPESSLSRYGFDSLMIAQLQTWIAEHLHLDVAMVRLMRGPSIKELSVELIAQLSAKGGVDQSRALVRPLNDVKAPRGHVVCFPPMAVDGEAFALFAEAAPELAVHAVQLPTFADPNAALLLESEDAQLAVLVDELMALPHAPISLYGHSMGGYIALSVARALAARGRAAAIVVLGAVPIPGLPAALASATIQTPDDITEGMAEQAIARLNTGAALQTSDRGRVIELARRDLWLTVKSRAADASVPSGQAVALLAGEGDTMPTIDKLPAGSLAELGYQQARTVSGGHLFLFDPAACRAVAALVVDALEVGEAS